MINNNGRSMPNDIDRDFCFWKQISVFGNTFHLRWQSNQQYIMNIHVKNFRVFAIFNQPFLIYIKFPTSVILYENFVTFSFKTMLKVSRIFSIN